jgi:hypothetical protein
VKGLPPASAQRALPGPIWVQFSPAVSCALASEITYPPSSETLDTVTVLTSPGAASYSTLRMHGSSPPGHES